MGLGWLTAVVAVACVGTAVPARASWMVPPPPYRAKDFTLVKRDGWFHCFYIRRDTSVHADSTERDFGHAISRDLYLWTQLPPVIPTRPAEWDNARVWAPDIVVEDGVYYMFYTGVTERPGTYAFHQRIGLATSTDLLTWNRYDEPVFSCAQVPWSYCDPLQYTGGEFRDSFVMANPLGPGWIMYYTSRPASDPSSYVVGTALSSGDLAQWVAGDPLWITHHSATGSPAAESPHVFHHNGLYYLMFTGSGDNALRIVTGPDPLGAAETWTYRGTIGDMLGPFTDEWFASEYFRDGANEYFAFVNFDRVDVRRIVWGSGWAFSLMQPPMFHVQRLLWSAPEVVNGQTVELTIEAVNTVGARADLEAYALHGDGTQQSIPLLELGFPKSIPLTGPTTVYPWTARSWPDPDHPDPGIQVVVRLKDLTAESGPLRIVADPWVPAGGTGDDGGIRRTPREFEWFGRQPPQDEFRALAGSPLGGTALLVNLAEAAPGRIQLFDLEGRLVRELGHRVWPAGASVVAWDGRDRSGAPARAGVYFARLATPRSVRTVRILLAP